MIILLPSLNIRRSTKYRSSYLVAAFRIKSNKNKEIANKNKFKNTSYKTVQMYKVYTNVQGCSQVLHLSCVVVMCMFMCECVLLYVCICVCVLYVWEVLMVEWLRMKCSRCLVMTGVCGIEFKSFRLNSGVDSWPDSRSFSFANLCLPYGVFDCRCFWNISMIWKSYHWLCGRDHPRALCFSLNELNVAILLVLVLS